jgi:DNA repair exonuclease SbcCD ATPase subunit
MSEIKSYIPYRGMIEVHGEGQGTYVSWYDYKTLLDRVNGVEELEKGKGYLTRLFNLVSPQCTPYEDLPGLVSQIDNYIAGLNIRLEELGLKHSELSHAFDVEREAKERSMATLTLVRQRIKGTEEALLNQRTHITNMVSTIIKLETDLKLNASMLAKQTDLAREAEMNAQHWYQKLDETEAERDGFRNGQAQVQAMLDEVMESNKKMAQDLATLKEAVTDLAVCITDLLSMFAYRLDDPPRISTGGLSVLEDAFEILGYDDPHPIPERQCQFEGCTKTATSGTPTKNGYMRVCLKHFEEINLKPKEEKK